MNMKDFFEENTDKAVLHTTNIRHKSMEEKKFYLANLREKLRQQGNIMSIINRTAMENTIEDILLEIRTPQDKLIDLQKELVRLKKRPSLFDAESLDYKIISHSIRSLEEKIQHIEEQLHKETTSQ